MSNLQNCVEIKNLKGPLPLELVVYSAAQPAPEQFAELATCGVATVVNLRPTAEMAGIDEAQLVQSQGMAYVHIPVADKADLTLVNARRLAAAFEDNSPPFLVHCAGGNRVGALLALKAFMVDGWMTDKALELGKLAGLSELSDLVGNIFGRAEKAE